MIATTYPLTIQNQIDRLFRIATQRPGRNTQVSLGGLSVQQTRGGAAVDWWLAGGISAANCIAAYQPKGAASLAASYINLANPGTYDAAPGVAPTFNVDYGWVFDIVHFLTCGIVVQQGWSIVVRVANVITSSNSAAFGSIDLSLGAHYVLLYPSAVAVGGRRYRNGINQNVPGPNIAAGIMAMAGGNCYLDGSPDGTFVESWAGPNTVESYIGARNYAPSRDGLRGTIASLSVYDTIITAPQVAAATTAMAAL